MSDTEKRVVKLEFDNKQFEKNAKKSMSTIDKLDEKLSLEGVTDSVKKVEKSFKKMDAVAFTVIQRLTNKIIDLGVSLTKSLSVDNIFTGWIKYGEKSTSVATMFAQEIKIAGKAINDEAKKIEVINEQLEKLNWFTDETSYNFTDMVNNIGKFTAAGVDLDKSVEAMMGIANWAALSGQNATTASRAMYQLAQTLGKGSVQLIDYKSIQNANMDTQEFRQTVLDTAVELKQLTKEGEKYITKTGKSFTKNQFTEELSEKWFSSDVLTKALGKYSAAVDKIYEISVETGLTASEVIARYGDELDTFGLKAFKAAQEARTFTDSLNSVKDAVSTGWMTTAEKIFGSYQESKELWTDLANELYDVFAAGGNFRNQVLSIWKGLEGRDDLFKHGGPNQGAFWNMYDAVIAVKQVIKDAWRSLFPITEFQAENDQAKDLGNKLKDITKRLQEWSAKLKNSIKENGKLYNVMRAIFSVVKVGEIAIRSILYILEPIWTAVKQMFDYLTTRMSLVSKNLERFNPILESFVSVVQTIHDSIENIIAALDPVGFLDKVFIGLSKVMKVISDAKPLEKVANFFNNFVETLKENGTNAENLGRIWKGLTSIVSMSFKLLKSVASLLSKVVTPVLEILLSLTANIVSIVSGLVTSLAAILGDFFTFLNGLFEGKLSDAGEKFDEFGNKVVNGLSKLKPIGNTIINIFKNLFDAIMLLPRALDSLSKKLTGSGIIDNFKKLGDGIANAFKKIGEAISSLFGGKSKQESKPKPNEQPVELVKTFTAFTSSKGMKSFNDELAATANETVKETNKLKGLVDALKEFLDGVISILQGLLDVLNTIIKGIGKILKGIGSALQQVAEAFSKFFDSFNIKDLGQLVFILSIVSLITLAAYSLYALFYGIKSLLAPVQYVAEALSDLMYGLKSYLMFQGLSYLISSIARMFLLFTISLMLLVHTIQNGDDWKGALGILAGFSAIIIAFTLALVLIGKNISSFTTNITKTGRLFSKDREVTQTSQGIDRMLYAMRSLVSVVTTGMIKLAIAIRIMSGIDTQQMLVSAGILGVFLVAISAILVIMTALSLKMKGSQKNIGSAGAVIKTAASIIQFAIALKFLANAIGSLGEMPEDQMWQGIKGMISILAAVGILATVVQAQLNFKHFKMGNGADFKAISAMLMKFALSMLVLMLSLKVLSSINSNELKKYLVAIAILVSVFSLLVAALKLLTSQVGGFNKVAKKSSKVFGNTALNIVAMGASVSLMASSLLIIAGSIAILSLVNWSKAWKGALALGLFMTAILAVMIILARSNKTLKKGQKETVGLYKTVLSLSVTMAAIGASMFILTASIALLSLANWNEAWKGALVAGIYITLLGAACVLMARAATKATVSTKNTHKSILALSVVLASISVSMLLITASMAILSKINWTDWLKGLAVLIVFLGTLVSSLILLTRFAKGSVLTGKDAYKSLLSLSLLLGSLSISLLLITASIAILSRFNWLDYLKGLAVLIVFLGTLVGSLALLTRFAKGSVLTGKDAVKTMLSLSALIGTITISFLILSSSLLIFNSLNSDSLWKAAAALGILAGVVGILLGSLAILKKIKVNGSDVLKVAGAILMVASSIAILGVSIKYFIDSSNKVAAMADQMTNSANTAGTALASATSGAFGATSNGGESNGEGSASGGGKSKSGILGAILTITGILLSITAALAILGKIISKTMKASKSTKEGLIQLGAMLVMLAAAMGAMYVFIQELSTFQGLDWGEIGKMAAGMGIISAMLFAIIGALALLQVAGIQPKTLINFAISLGIMVVALLGFIGALYLLQDVKMATIGKAALILAGAMLVMVAAGYLMQPIIPVITQFAIALFIMATAFMLTAAAMGAMAEALGPFMESFNENFDMIAETIGNVATLLVVGLLDAFETLLTKLTEIMPKIADFVITLVSEILRVINELVPEIASTLVNILSIVLEFLAESADTIWESILKLISSLLKLLKKYVPTIVQDLCELFIMIIQNLGKYISQIVTTLMDLLIKIIDCIFGPQGMSFFLHVISTILTFIGNIFAHLVNYVIQFAGLLAKLLLILIAAGLQIALQLLGTLASYLIAFFGGLIWLCVEVIRGLSNVIYTALKNIFVLIIETLGKVLSELGPLLMSAGRYMMAMIAKGFLEVIRDSFVGKLLQFFGVSFDGAIGAVDRYANEMNSKMHNIAGDMGQAIKDAGKNIMSTVKTISTTMQDITADGMEVISGTVDSSAANIAAAMGDFGKNMSMNLADGLAQGAQDSATTAQQSGKLLGDSAIEGFKEECQINSPSRVMMKMGEYMAEGLAVGVVDNENTAVDAMKEVVTATVDAVDEMVDEGVGDNTLTITPVLDLNNVRNGVADISSMMTSINGASVSSELATNTSREIQRSRLAREDASRNQNGVNTVNNEGDTYNCTFNVTADNPEDFANEVDRLLQRKRMQYKMAKGG